ncbi:hypothetical protein LZ30DRAFT_471140 [Colletotrichum cereale]|nr:hypothetical protein LZ30DRAFT_471140 [Colletotrichum cereale]
MSTDTDGNESATLGCGEGCVVASEGTSTNTRCPDVGMASRCNRSHCRRGSRPLGNISIINQTICDGQQHCGNVLRMTSRRRCFAGLRYQRARCLFGPGLGLSCQMVVVSRPRRGNDGQSRAPSMLP